LIPQLDCTTPLTGRATKKLIFDTFLKGSNAADIEAFVDELVRMQKISTAVGKKLKSLPLVLIPTLRFVENGQCACS